MTSIAYFLAANEGARINANAPAYLRCAPRVVCVQNTQVFCGALQRAGSRQASRPEVFSLRASKHGKMKALHSKPLEEDCLCQSTIGGTAISGQENS